MIRSAHLAISLALAAAACRGQDAPPQPPEPKVAAAPPSAAPPEKQTMPSDADTHLRQLSDPDEAVRARAAVALHAMSHPGALDACIRTLDDAADELHNDRTPAVQCLVEIGAPALPSLYAPLAADQDMTRLHAQRAVEGITRRMLGFDGRAWKTGSADAWITWWGTIGYAYDAGPDQRKQAIDRLRAWAAAH
jgi:HEAT repeat protein